MHRFFAERSGDNAALLPPDEARHATTVLRLKPGDEVCAVVDGELYRAQIIDAADAVRLTLFEALPSPEARTRVTLYQGLPKGDKMDYIVQKCTEAGIFEIVPVLMPRSVVRLDQKDAEKRAERWRRIALEAAKQSGRTRAPLVRAPVGVGSMLSELPKCPLALVPWEDERAVSLRAALEKRPERDIALVIGPEGGMGAEEIKALTAAGAKPVTLGPRIFRTETAGLAALIMALTISGDYE